MKLDEIRTSFVGDKKLWIKFRKKCVKEHTRTWDVIKKCLKEYVNNK